MTRAGAEIGVASTKALYYSVTALLLLTLFTWPSTKNYEPNWKKSLIAELDQVTAICENYSAIK